MKYFKVKKNADQKRRKDGSIYIANELYTPKEAEKYNINPDYCDIVEISQRKTYWCFGARFAMENLNA